MDQQQQQQEEQCQLHHQKAKTQGQLPAMKKGHRDTGHKLSNAGNQKAQPRRHEDLNLQIAGFVTPDMFLLLELFLKTTLVAPPIKKETPTNV